MATAEDILTYEEAVNALNLSQSRSAPDVLEMWVTAVSQRIDALCGPVVIREVVDTLDANGPYLTPNYRPVDSVTSVVEYVSGTGRTLTAEDIDTVGDYLLVDDQLTRRSGWYTWSWQGRVVVTYDAGRYADTESVDAKFKLCASAILRRLWAREAGAWGRADPFGGEDQGSLGFFSVIDPAVREWLADEMRTPAIA